MAYAVITDVEAVSTDGNTVTTGNVDTTGATLIILMVSQFFYDGTPTDSKSNTWTALTGQVSGLIRGKLFYCLNPTVGSGHNFTFAPGASGNPGIAVLALSGAGQVLTFDQQNGAASSTNSRATGNVTPTEGDEILVSGLATDGTGLTITEPADWTRTANLVSTGNTQGAQFAYKIQTTATTEGATWGSSSTVNMSAVIASFRASSTNDIADDLVAFWPLNEASGNAIDAHSSNDGTETNGPIGTGTGVAYSTARDLERGSTQYFDVGDTADLSVGSASATWCAWAKLESNGFKQAILGKRTSYYLAVTDTNNFTNEIYSSSGYGGGKTVNATNFGGVSTGVWCFVAWFYDHAGGLLGISVNAGTPNTTAHSAGIYDSTDGFRIGHDGESSEHFDGLIGPAMFFKRALHADEIAWLYNAGAGRTYEDLVPPPGGGLSIPIAMYHYQHHLQSMAG